MKFCIADSFPKALARLSAQEQKAVKTTVFDLQLDYTQPSLQFHRIENSKDVNFWSVRVNSDVRIIIHKTESSFLICYVDHHDDAYAWAERRRIEAHPTTGAAQIVETRERIEEIHITRPIDVPEPIRKPELPLLFVTYKDEELLKYGVPIDWLADVKKATEDSLFDLAVHLPQEAAEALLDLAVGKKPEIQQTLSPDTTDPFLHPDAQRRFRVLDDADELARALDYPWDQWTVFLHPSQRLIVNQTFNGPARVSGSAGTGKTVVAIHRAANILKKDPAARLLLTTFSLPLANALKTKLEILTGKDNSIAHRVTVLSFKNVAYDLYTLAYGYHPRAVTDDQMRAILEDVASKLEITDFTARFLFSEWSNVVDAWQVDTIDSYRDVARLGRKNRMSAQKRERIWPIFMEARKRLNDQGVLSWPTIFEKVAIHYKDREHKPFTHIMVDEAQDLGVPELKMLSSITPEGANSMFFAGDLGQRIFQEPFSWKSLGVDIRGRSRTLKVNYRTSHQIRQSADQLLPKVVRDVDGNQEDRAGTISVFNGPEPVVKVFPDAIAEIQWISDWILKMVLEGVEPAEIGIFVRSHEQLIRARQSVHKAGHDVLELSERAEEATGRVSIGVMHLAKGLEFKAVAVMACDDEVLPLQTRIENAADEVELEEFYETERHLFYVACTRAREHLIVCGIQPASEFFRDLTT